jgi:hypothetical protein
VLGPPIWRFILQAAPATSDIFSVVYAICRSKFWMKAGAATVTGAAEKLDLSAKTAQKSGNSAGDLAGLVGRNDLA